MKPQACTKCKVVKKPTEFAKDKRRLNGCVSECRKCQSARERKLRESRDHKLLTSQMLAKRRFYEKNRESERIRCRNYKRNHKKQRDPIKERARYAVWYAVKTGKIKKPQNCTKCMSTERIHGHHHDYKKPLEIEWLCSLCHGVARRKPIARQTLEETTASDFMRREVLDELNKACSDSRCGCDSEPEGTDCDYCLRRAVAFDAARAELERTKL